MTKKTVKHDAVVFGPAIAKIKRIPITSTVDANKSDYSIYLEVEEIIRAEFFKGRYLTTRTFGNVNVLTSDSALLDMEEPLNDYATPIRGPIVAVYKVDEENPSIPSSTLLRTCIEPIRQETRRNLTEPSFKMFSLNGDLNETSPTSLMDDIASTFTSAQLWALYGSVNPEDPKEKEGLIPPLVVKEENQIN